LTGAALQQRKREQKRKEKWEAGERERRKGRKWMEMNEKPSYEINSLLRPLVQSKYIITDSLKY